MDFLHIKEYPDISDGRLVVGFSGWMDGGEVSTGTAKYLVEKLGAREFAHIDPQPFYLYSFPGSMELSAEFRPHVVIEDGLVQDYHAPASTFYYSTADRLVIFIGKEPNLRWQDFTDAIFAIVERCNIQQILFTGSISGMVPHSRDPRFLGSVNEEGHLPFLEAWGVTPSEYEGPGSFITNLTVQSRGRGIQMASIVAEVPSYVHGENPRCIESMTRKLVGMLGLNLDLTELELRRRLFEGKLAEAVESRAELAELVKRLEKEYDADDGDRDMDDLRAWFEKQDFRLE